MWHESGNLLPQVKGIQNKTVEKIIKNNNLSKGVLFDKLLFINIVYKIMI